MQCLEGKGHLTFSFYPFFQGSSDWQPFNPVGYQWETIPPSIDSFWFLCMSGPKTCPWIQHCFSLQDRNSLDPQAPVLWTCCFWNSQKGSLFFINLMYINVGHRYIPLETYMQLGLFCYFSKIQWDYKWYCDWGGNGKKRRMKECNTLTFINIETTTNPFGLFAASVTLVYSSWL